jgi:glycosyltransferase involved in cell wall biosynthesis
MLKYSVIIRVKNEAENLRRCLGCIQSQKDYSPKNCEVIVIDNKSTDSTRDVAEQFGAKVLTIDQFSYPKAMNMGLRAAGSPVGIFLSAHSYIKGDQFLVACEQLFSEENVAGVWGPVYASDQASVWERLFYGACNLLGFAGRVYKPKKAKLGHMGATNCAVRTSIALRNPFDERFGHGGEDYQWALWAINNHYTIVRDPRLAIYHSHGLSLGRLIAQYRKWHYTIHKPGKFPKS